MLIRLANSLFAIAQRFWLVLAIPVLFPALLWSQEYTLTSLATLGGSSSFSYAVNNAGEVVGMAALAGDTKLEPFLYYNGKMTDVWTGGTEFGGTTVAINNSGHFVVNYNLDAKGYYTESFLWNGAIWADLGIGGATGMNASDTVVGGSMQGLSAHDYWVYANGQLNTSPGYSLPDGTHASGDAINDSGSITGTCEHANPSDGYYGCVYGPTAPTWFQSTNTAGPGYAPYVIASDGRTCGMNPAQHFAEWSNVGTETYEVEIGYWAQCTGLDDYGDAVGFGENYGVGPENHGYIHDPINQLRDLNNLVPHIFPKGHAVTIDSVASISNTGFIAATCSYPTSGGNEALRACLLTPNWATILKDNIGALAKGDPECIQCKTILEPEANSLPSNFAGLSSAEKKKAMGTVEKMASRLRALRGESQISEQKFVLMQHDTQMALQALANRRG